MHLSIHIDLGVKTQEVRQAGVGRNEVWERTRQRQQGRYALASRHEDTWDTQPGDAVGWWHMGEKSACVFLAGCSSL